jgi:hypothetical protein
VDAKAPKFGVWTPPGLHTRLVVPVLLRARLSSPLFECLKTTTNFSLYGGCRPTALDRSPGDWNCPVDDFVSRALMAVVMKQGGFKQFHLGKMAAVVYPRAPRTYPKTMLRSKRITALKPNDREALAAGVTAQLCTKRTA